MRHLFFVMVLIASLTGCAVMGEPITYQAGKETLHLNAEVSGRTFTAQVFIDETPILTHHYPPFVNSRDVQVVQYHNHEIRSVLRIIKGIGNTMAQVYVDVDGTRAGEFFF